MPSFDKAVSTIEFRMQADADVLCDDLSTATIRTHLFLRADGRSCALLVVMRSTMRDNLAKIARLLTKRVTQGKGVFDETRLEEDSALGSLKPLDGLPYVACTFEAKAVYTSNLTQMLIRGANWLDWLLSGAGRIKSLELGNQSVYVRADGQLFTPAEFFGQMIMQRYQEA